MNAAQRRPVTGCPSRAASPRRLGVCRRNRRGGGAGDVPSGLGSVSRLLDGQRCGHLFPDCVEGVRGS
jgi:hypothetical protein